MNTQKSTTLTVEQWDKSISLVIPRDADLDDMIGTFDLVLKWMTFGTTITELLEEKDKMLSEQSPLEVSVFDQIG